MKAIRSSIVLVSIVAILALGITACTSPSETTAGNSTGFTTDTNTGIVSINGHPIDPQKTANVVQMAATAGSAFAVSQDPNAGPYLIAAAAAIDVAVNSGIYDVNGLQTALNKISVKEIRDSAAAKSAIATAVAVYSTYADDVNSATGLDKNAYVVPVLRALAKGFEAGASASVNAAKTN